MTTAELPTVEALPVPPAPLLLLLAPLCAVAAVRILLWDYKNRGTKEEWKEADASTRQPSVADRWASLKYVLGVWKEGFDTPDFEGWWNRMDLMLELAELNSPGSVSIAVLWYRSKSPARNKVFSLIATDFVLDAVRTVREGIMLMVCYSFLAPLPRSAALVFQCLPLEADTPTICDAPSMRQDLRAALRLAPPSADALRAAAAQPEVVTELFRLVALEAAEIVAVSFWDWNMILSDESAE